MCHFLIVSLVSESLCCRLGQSTTRPRVLRVALPSLHLRRGILTAVIPFFSHRDNPSMGRNPEICLKRCLVGQNHLLVPAFVAFAQTVVVEDPDRLLRADCRISAVQQQLPPGPSSPVQHRHERQYVAVSSLTHFHSTQVEFCSVLAQHPRCRSSEDFVILQGFCGARRL